MIKTMPMFDAPEAAPRRWARFTLALSGTFLANVTVFIVVVALPSIGSQLRASGAQQQLILAGYELVYAIGVIPGGRLGDSYGQFRVFGIGMAVFTLASTGCALAPSATVLVITRLAQAAGTALLVPQVYSLARTLFEPRERTRAFALAGVVMGAGAIAGQAVGGFLVTVNPFGLGWRVVFWIVVPFGVAALAATPAAAVRTRHGMPPGSPVLPGNTARGGLDLPGAGLAALALFAVVLPLTMGHDWGWPWWTAPVLLASVPVAAVFARRQRRLEDAGRSPLVPPSLLRRPGVGWGLAMTAVFGSGITAFFWLLALDLQNGRGLDPAGAGLMMLPLATAFAAASLTAPRLSPDHPERAVITGSVITALGYGAIAAVGTPPLPVLAVVLAVVGAGQGLAITPMLSLTLRAVPARQAGAGSGLVVTAQQLGSALGVCLFGLVFYGMLSADFYGTGAAVIAAFRVTIAALPVTALGAALIARRL